MRPRFALPLAARNPISLIGIVIATAMAWVFLTLFVLDALGYLLIVRGYPGEDGMLRPSIHIASRARSSAVSARAPRLGPQ